MLQRARTAAVLPVTAACFKEMLDAVKCEKAAGISLCLAAAPMVCTVCVAYICVKRECVRRCVCERKLLWKTAPWSASVLYKLLIMYQLHPSINAATATAATGPAPSSEHGWPRTHQRVNDALCKVKGCQHTVW
jgi:hypothetical protein